MPGRPSIPTHYHYKTQNLYALVGYAQHSEDGSRLAIYYDEAGALWARPAEMFDEQDRFRPVFPTGSVVDDEPILLSKMYRNEGRETRLQIRGWPTKKPGA